MNETVKIGGEELELARFDREGFEQAYNSGALAGLGRFELVEGILIKMPPSGLRHGKILARLTIFLGTNISDAYDIASDSGVYVGADTLYGPDILVLKRPTGDGFAEAGDVVLAIEISDSTLSRDTREKAGRYAAAGISDYWSVDVENRLLRVFREPSPDGYRRVDVLEWEQPVEPLCASGLAVRLSDILE